MNEKQKINKDLYVDTYEGTPIDESALSSAEKKARVLNHPLPYAGIATAEQNDTSDKNRIPCVLSFNKASKALVGLAASTESATVPASDDTFIYKVVNMDPDHESWVGDYDTGSITNNSSAPIQIDEYELNAWCHNRIQRIYKHYNQLNILRKAVLALVKKTGLTSSDDPIVDELNDLDEFIEKMIANNDKYAAEYKASPAFNFLTKEDYDKQEEAGRAGVLGTKLEPLNKVTIQHKWESIAE
jgi:hypothetical protein